ncbi:MAG: multidrug ABC transporter ATP-binding protein, partial [Clostridia bacterium]|nr:multidrug ABC transporter ATP-binding protein [Clostridia bacterium]
LHSAEAVPVQKPKPKENEYLRKKEEQSEERKRRGKIKRLEAAIAEAEEKASALETQLADPAVAADYEKVLALTAELDAAHASLTALYDEWEALQT